MEIQSTSQSNNPPLVEKDQLGFNGLDAEAFMKLLITEMQNQDPLEPMGNEQILNQISVMRNLQANVELSDTLKSINSNQQLSAAAAFIGKKITGTNVDNQLITGTVDRAFVADNKVYVGVGATAVAVAQIQGVHAA